MCSLKYCASSQPLDIKLVTVLHLIISTIQNTFYTIIETPKYARLFLFHKNIISEHIKMKT